MKTVILSLATALVFGSGCGTDTVPGAANSSPSSPVESSGFLFDDFSYPDAAALTQHGWIVRSAAGWPGVPGARWGEGSVAIVEDPAQPGNQVVRLVASTDGTLGGTRQAQLCHERKYLEGTYAARVRFSDAPVSGPDVDQMVQSFYSISGYLGDLSPQYSELDFEYLPNGGWSEAGSVLVNTSWETVRIEPWLAFNESSRLPGSQDGWQVLAMQVSHGTVRYFVDGAQVAEHGGRNYPRVPMSINFNLWFILQGLSQERAPRVWNEEIDWTYHARNRVLSTAEVESEVNRLRQVGTNYVDSVPAADPPLPCLCDL